MILHITTTKNSNEVSKRFKTPQGFFFIIIWFNYLERKCPMMWGLFSLLSTVNCHKTVIPAPEYLPLIKPHFTCFTIKTWPLPIGSSQPQGTENDQISLKAWLLSSPLNLQMTYDTQYTCRIKICVRSSLLRLVVVVPEHVCAIIPASVSAKARWLKSLHLYILAGIGAFRFNLGYGPAGEHRQWPFCTLQWLYSYVVILFRPPACLSRSFLFHTALTFYEIDSLRIGFWVLCWFVIRFQKLQFNHKEPISG